MYTFTLGNGKTISNVRQNGDLFSCSDTFSREELDAGLASFSISGKPDAELDYDKSGSYKLMKVGYWRETPEGREFTIVPLSQEEVMRKEFDAKIDYIAMMTEVTL